MPEHFGDPTHIQHSVGDSSSGPVIEPEGLDTSVDPVNQVVIDDLVGKDAANTADELAALRTEIETETKPEADIETELTRTVEEYRTKAEQNIEFYRNYKTLKWLQDNNHTHFTLEFFEKRHSVFLSELDRIMSNTDLSPDRKLSRVTQTYQSYERDGINGRKAMENRFSEVQGIIRAEYVDQRMDEIATEFYGIIEKIEDEEARQQKTRDLQSNMRDLSWRINDLIESCDFDMDSIKVKLNDYIVEFERNFRATL